VTCAQGHVVRIWNEAETTLLITCGFVLFEIKSNKG
jgi:hypothetical protein